MEKLLFVMASLLLTVSTTVQAQGKADQVKRIRQLYAQAKQQVENNGKNGANPLDMVIHVSNPELVSEDFELDDETNVYYYFNREKKEADTDFLERTKCYFIIEGWTSHGHTRYREFLFDPEEERLLFAYMKGETDGGFIVETRYYYDDKGNLIDQKHKMGNSDYGLSDAEPGSHTWNDSDSEKEAASFYLQLFDSVLHPANDPSAASQRSDHATPKAERLAFIRSAYTQAKQKIEKDKQAEYARTAQITIHDQYLEDGPPVTGEISYYFEDVKGKADDQVTKHCYFVSDHRSSMYFDHYAEYLFDTKGDDLIFSFTRAREENEVMEWRYYFDENRRCIESKVNADSSDNGKADQVVAKALADVFNMLVTP